MSDYLWDKTGEPDEDVEQLENLLGALKYKHRPLEIPAATIPMRARPAATTMIFSRPRLAIAASLILMLLAGTWFVTRQGEQQINKLAKVEQGSPTPESRQPQMAVVVKPETDNNVPVNKVEQLKPREDKNNIIHTAAPKPHRLSRQLVVKRQKQQQPRVKDDAASPQREEIAEGREATEKLMLALRLASAKLNFAQRELQEISRANK